MVTIEIDNQTGEIIFEENGSRIYDPSQITYIKRHSNWKARVYELSTNLKNEIDFNVENKRIIHTRVPKMLTEQEIKKKISSLYCNTYRIPDYSKRSDNDIKRDADYFAKKYAECNVTSNIFCKKKQKEQIIKKKLPEFIEFYKAKDADAEARYYAEENKIKIQKDAEYKAQYEDERNGLLKYITDDELKITKNVAECLSSISTSIVKIVTNATYKSFPSNTCTVILHLPDTSCIERRTGNILASGKISIKQRKVIDIKDDWNLFCNGLILYVVGSIFNVNTCIQNVSISARYTELNKVYGSNTIVDFVNCDFDRKSFSNINFLNINPVDTIQAFATGVISGSKQNMQKQKILNTQNASSKSPFKIECYDELSKNSLSIIDAGLRALFMRYDKFIFEEENKNRFLSAVKDIFPKNEAERQIVESLIMSNFFSDYVDSLDVENTKNHMVEILSENNLDSDTFLTNLELMIEGK